MGLLLLTGPVAAVLACTTVDFAVRGNCNATDTQLSVSQAAV